MTKKNKSFIGLKLIIIVYKRHLLNTFSIFCPYLQTTILTLVRFFQLKKAKILSSSTVALGKTIILRQLGSINTNYGQIL